MSANTIPSLRCLKAFHAVVTLGSVSAAAEYLCITQPAVSYLLRSLEESCGLKLFQKSGRTLKLSEDGRIFFEQVANGLQVLQELENTASAIRSARLGHVRIVCLPVIADFLMPHFLAGFTADNPEIQVTLEVAEGHRALVLLETGVVDLALIASDALQHVKIHCRFFSPVSMIAPKGTLATAARPMAPNALAETSQLPFIAVSGDSPFRRMIDRHLNAAEISLTGQIQARTQASIAGLVRNGAGFSLVDHWVAKASSQELQILRPEPSISWHYALISRESTSLTSTNQRFVSELAAYAQELEQAGQTLASRQ